MNPGKKPNNSEPMGDCDLGNSYLTVKDLYTGCFSLIRMHTTNGCEGLRRRPVFASTGPCTATVNGTCSVSGAARPTYCTLYQLRSLIDDYDWWHELFCWPDAFLKPVRGCKLGFQNRDPETSTYCDNNFFRQFIFYTGILYFYRWLFLCGKLIVFSHVTNINTLRVLKWENENTHPDRIYRRPIRGLSMEIPN